MEAASPRPILRASICIPTRNRAELLRLTLESLDRQTISADRFEVIVGDDGSTDETVAMLGGLRPRYPLTWRRATGSGPGAARNASDAGVVMAQSRRHAGHSGAPSGHPGRRRFCRAEPRAG